MFFRKKKLNNSIIGIDFAYDEIRTVELEKSTSGKKDYKMLNYVIQKLPAGSLKESTIVTEILGECFKAATEEEHFKTNKAISCVSSEYVMVKEFKVPLDASEKETEDIIKNSAKTHYPKGIENVAFDFFELVEKRSEEGKSIVLKMCPLEAISSREDVLSMADLDPIAIDIDSAAISRMSTTFYKQYYEEMGREISDNDSILILDISRAKIKIRVMKLGLVNNTEEIFLKSSIDVKREDSLCDASIKFINKKKLIETTNDEVVKAVFLTGSMEDLVLLKEMLDDSEAMDIDVFIANPLVNIECAGVHPVDIINAAPSLVLACGLAMKDISNYE